MRTIQRPFIGYAISAVLMIASTASAQSQLEINDGASKPLASLMAEEDAIDAGFAVDAGVNLATLIDDAVKAIESEA